MRQRQRRPIRSWSAVIVGIFVMHLLATGLRAQLPPAPAATAVDFLKDVAPIFRRSCIECHGPEKQEGDLRLDRRPGVGSESTIRPGKPEESELWRRITLPRGHDEIMPAVGEPLEREQIETIRRWIAQGATWPDQESNQTHWAYVKPSRPRLPGVSDPTWIRQPLDHFVLQRLDQASLGPSPRAAPEKLVRRLYLDLIGLPPTLDQVRHFAADPSDERLERIVDDLLNRPQFGERWARPWLDAARYADSHGFQRDNLRDMWAYRDWVIRALNDDMPMDQFSIEQLAGDLLPDATESQRIATGFHRCSPTNVEAGSLPEETRIEQVIDRVNTTAAVWLGTTLECCQCHDHKYDPFKQSEYYRLLAFFNNTQMEADRADPKKPSSIDFLGPSMPISNRDRDRQRAAVTDKIAELKARQQDRREAAIASLETWIAEFISSADQTAQMHLLEPIGLSSEGSTDSFSKLDDGSILIVGDDPPDTDVVAFSVRTPLQKIRGFYLEALRHDALPGKGPGRGDATRRNFILNEFTVQLRPVAESQEHSARPLKFASAQASYSQSGWPVDGAVDGDSKSGWAIAPQFDRSHWAAFILEQPIDVPEGVELAFQLRQNFGQARTIGCFRISAITGDSSQFGGKAISSEVLAAAMTPPAERTKAQRKALVDYRIGQDTESVELERALAALEKQLVELAPETTQIMVELPTPRETAVFERGDYRKPGPPVSPGTPEALHPMLDQRRDRLALAHWLTSPENPLVARVTVNRWWAELFGQGIVATLEDFGIKGDAPTHPELLDWLAVDLIDGGWSMKRWLKTVVLSATYQQSSAITAQLHAIDPQNRLLARGPRLRMDAEMIRDNALAISGLLDTAQFGPPIRPYQPAGFWSKVGGTAYDYQPSPLGERHRRGIYVVLKRGSPYPSFISFDASARQTCTLRRSRTNTPLQALTLMNDPVYVEAAQALAERARRELSGQPLSEQLESLFQLCTARRPTETERQALHDLYTQQLAASATRGDQDGAADQQRGSPTARSGRAGRRRQGQVADDRPVEQAAWSSVATVLLNLHETITKD